MNSSKLHCANWTENETFIEDKINYWVGGVVVLIVSIIGIVLNVIGICLISRRLLSRNIFNHLIVILFVVDCFYLTLMIFFVMDQNLGLSNTLLIILFPHVTYPLCHICFTMSILMTIGIAYERCNAIRDPIIHRQQLLSSKFRRTKLIKYMLPIILYAITFNAPKFFEFELTWTANKR